MNIDGTLIETDRVAAPGPTEGVDLWWPGKHHTHGGGRSGWREDAIILPATWTAKDYLYRVRVMTQAPRMTLQTQLVLRAMLAEPAAERYGLQLCAETGLPSGTIYPIVARLEQLGWVESHWEDPRDHVAEGRPRRRYYRLTDEGADQARGALARVDRARKQPRFGRGVTRPGISGMSR